MHFGGFEEFVQFNGVHWMSKDALMSRAGERIVDESQFEDMQGLKLQASSFKARTPVECAYD